MLLTAPCLLLLAQGPPALTRDEIALMSAIDANTPAAVALYEKMINQNSGTFHLAGVRVIAEWMEAELKALGFETRMIPLAAIQRAAHLYAERKGRPGSGKPIHLIAHMDTVFEPSSPFQKFERKGRSAVGPGVSDDKGGLIVMLLALKSMKQTGHLEGIPITIFLTGDEEAPGELAVTRKEFIEAGKRARVGLCFEPGIRGVNQDFGSTARRGFLGWELRSTGVAGHSGQIFSEKYGYGANFELSRVLNAFREQLPEPNMTFNVGMILGGAEPKAERSGEGSVKGKDNIIAAAALARGEVRALTPEQVARIKDQMYAIVAKSLPGTSSEIRFQEGYPPMAPTAGNKKILKLLSEESVRAGLGEIGELDPMQRGAGDISFIAPFVDSLSGLGAIGAGAHAAGESVDLESIPKQAKRAALLIKALDGGAK